MAENADSVSCSTVEIAENTVVTKGLASAKRVENLETNVNCTRKLHDLGDFIEKPINGDGFRETKSSRKAFSVLG